MSSHLKQTADFFFFFFLFLFLTLATIELFKLFGSGLSKQNYYKVWMTLAQINMSCPWKIFFYFSSGSHLVHHRKKKCYFDREPPRQHFCEAWIKLATGLDVVHIHNQLLTFFLFFFSILSTKVLAILVEGHLRNIPMKFEGNWHRGIGWVVVYIFFSTFSSGSHLLNQRGTILAILARSHLDNILGKIGSYWP